MGKEGTGSAVRSGACPLSATEASQSPGDCPPSFRLFFLGSTNPELVICDDNKCSFPGVDKFCLKNGVNSSDKCFTAWRSEPNEQESRVCSRCKTADIGKV